MRVQMKAQIGKRTEVVALANLADFKTILRAVYWRMHTSSTPSILK